MRYGSVHSSGKNIIPIGDSVGFRFMLDDYQKGNFWSRTIAKHDDSAKSLYPDKRTYQKQIQDAIKGGAKEIFICIDTPKNDFLGIENFTGAIIDKVRELGYTKELILSPPNESLEHMSVTEYVNVANAMNYIVRESDTAKLSIGGMASEFTDFYRRIAVEIPYYDYIDFHTSNDGNLWSIEWLLNNMPANIPLINSEHYLMNCAKISGYDSDFCLQCMKLITDYMFNQERIKSIYVTVPSAYKEKPDDRDVILRYVDLKNNIIKTTRMWYLLKLYEEGKEIMNKLLELKRGDKGFQVLVLQKILNFGADKPMKVDGVFEGVTEKAVNKYRKGIGFIENGVCSYSVWYMLLITEDTRFLVLGLFGVLAVM